MLRKMILIIAAIAAIGGMVALSSNEASARWGGRGWAEATPLSAGLVSPASVDWDGAEEDGDGVAEGGDGVVLALPAWVGVAQDGASPVPVGVGDGAGVGQDGADGDGVVSAS